MALLKNKTLYRNVTFAQSITTELGNHFKIASSYFRQNLKIFIPVKIKTI